MKKTRRILDSITSYRVVLYSLVALTVSALSLSFLDVLTYSSFGVLSSSLALLLVVCIFTNILLGKLYKVPTNHESSIITAFILFFILAMPTLSYQWAGLIFTALVAMASKYVITWRSSHIFNPAAYGVLLASIVGVGNGSWWIADKSMFIPMLLVGFLVLLKLRHFQLFLTFFVSALALIIIKSTPDTTLVSAITTAITLYPLLFLGSIMLTEPSTMPTTRINRLIFAVIVGFVFATNFDFGIIASSPHLALIIGNVFAFLVSQRSSVILKLTEKIQLTPSTYSFSFKPSNPLKYSAGQFIELTLPGIKLDSRGNRRTFTIASSPRENLIKIGVKFNNPGSQFKTKLQSLKIGDTVLGNHVAGDFTLPKQSSVPLVFIAGGIGITPFIAIMKGMILSKQKNKAELYYFVSDKSELAYKDVLKSAMDYGVKINLRIGKGSKLTDSDINKHAGAQFYLSGPPGLVGAYKAKLQKMGTKQIHVDYFTGY